MITDHFPGRHFWDSFQGPVLSNDRSIYQELHHRVAVDTPLQVINEGNFFSAAKKKRHPVLRQSTHYKDFRQR
jgi:hypothetical protein